MADDELVALLKTNKNAFGRWRLENPQLRPDLTGADLSAASLRRTFLFEADLSGANLTQAILSGANLSETDLSRADLSAANLRRANLSEADLSRANLTWADLSTADLSGANLSEASLHEANLRRANLFEADLIRANLTWADLSAANLSGAHLGGANLGGANLSAADLSAANLSGAFLFEADLSGAKLTQTNLSEADLTQANLSEADLSRTALIGTNLTSATLAGCRIYGVSVWGVNLEQANQENLVITGPDEPEITVDNIEVAQFIYLLLHNQKIRDVIDTIGKKAVLILGRSTQERKKVLDALRDELRQRDYLPILFDFEKPTSKDLTGTVLTLAHMARFIIADLTDPSCIPFEVSKVSEAYVPIQPILLFGKSEFAMFADLQRRHHWVLPTHCYDSQKELIAHLDERVIRPAEDKVQELRGQVP
jgi:uncharacterized protein YjbI with pentapeptide repeats